MCIERFLEDCQFRSCFELDGVLYDLYDDDPSSPPLTGRDEYSFQIPAKNRSTGETVYFRNDTIVVSHYLTIIERQFGKVGECQRCIDEDLSAFQRAPISLPDWLK